MSSSSYKVKGTCTHFNQRHQIIINWQNTAKLELLINSFDKSWNNRLFKYICTNMSLMHEGFAAQILKVMCKFWQKRQYCKFHSIPSQMSLTFKILHTWTVGNCWLSVHGSPHLMSNHLGFWPWPHYFQSLAVSGIGVHPENYSVIPRFVSFVASSCRLFASLIE